MDIYSSTRCIILYGGKLSSEFTSHKGLMQGSVLSPLLFNIFINELLTILDSKLTGIMYGYPFKWSNSQSQNTMIQPYKVTSCAYADGLATINDDADGVQNSINIIYAFCKKWRLTINCKKGKTEVLVMYPLSEEIIQHQWITPTDEIIHRTSQYTYLGMILCEGGSMKHYVEHRTQSSINTMGALYDSQLLRPGVSLEC